MGGRVNRKAAADSTIGQPLAYVNDTRRSTKQTNLSAARDPVYLGTAGRGNSHRKVVGLFQKFIGEMDVANRAIGVPGDRPPGAR